MDPVPSACPLDCPDACGVLVERHPDGSFARVRGNPDHPWSKGSLCGKTAIYGEVVNGKQRVLQPLVRNATGELEEASWEVALDRIAAGLGAVAPERLLALSYAGNMGQVGRLYPMRLMHALGACETDGAVCDATAEEGYAAVFGRAVGANLTVACDDADVIVLWGCDARRTVQHLVPRLKAALERGARLLIVDIYRTDTIRYLERFGAEAMLIEPGSDALLALGLCAIAFEERAADLAFLKEHCEGAAEFRAHVAGAYSLDEVAAGTGLDAQQVRDFAEVVHAAQRPLFKLGVGWTRRRNGGMSMRAVLSWTAVLGREERVHWESGDFFDMDGSPIAGEDRRQGRPRVVIPHVELGAELCSGRFDAVVVWGHNPVVTVPDATRVAKGLSRDDLFLVVHEVALTETAALADVVLPATAFVEHTDLLRSYGQRVVQLARAAAPPRGESRSNVGAFVSIAERLGLRDAMGTTDEEALVREVLEHNADRFQPNELERILAGEPVQLGDHPQDPGRGTPSGKIELFSKTLGAQGMPPMATFVPDDGAGTTGAFQLILAPSVATHNSTYLYSSRHAARNGDAVVHIHPDDAAAAGIVEGAQVRLSNEVGAITMAAHLDDQVRRHSARVDGFVSGDQVPEGIGVNALVPGRGSDLGRGNVLYSPRVDLRPA